MNSGLILTILNVLATLLLLSIYDGILLRRKINSISFDVKENVYSSLRKNSSDEEYSSDEEELSSYEIERLEREADLDRRIELLKQELEYENQSKGYIAEELDPNVYNLPHNSIPSLINDDYDEVAN